MAGASARKRTLRSSNPLPPVPYTKPYLAVPDQLALIRSRGMAISDLPKATEMLNRIGYYRLSGYWYPFRASTTGATGAVVGDSFRPGSDLGTIIDLYIFDKKLRLLMMDAFERIEIALRIQIALTLGRRGAWAHRDPQALHGNFARRTDPKAKKVLHQQWLQKTDDQFNASKEEFAKHFRRRYSDDNPPIWIACEAWDFGAMSHLYSGMQIVDRDEIAAEYGLTGDVLASWIRNINVARNVCAHHSRLWNKPIPAQPVWPARVSDLGHLSGNIAAQTRAYGTAALTRYLLRQTSPATSWGARFKGLIFSFPTSPMISLASAGFPAGWEAQPLWA